MKKILIVMALVLALVLSLAACGEEKPAPTDAPATTADTTEAQAPAAEGLSAEDVVFSYNGVNVELDGDAQAALAALGAPVSESSQLSCHGQGDDKTYKYEGFILNTYPLDGEDRVLEIVINGEGITTSKGIKIGDSADAVTAAYGDGYRKIGMYYAYNAADGKKSLQFFMENDTVKEIDYYYDV